MTDRRDGFPRPGTGPGSDSPRPGEPGYADSARAREGGGEDSTVLRSSLRQGRSQRPGQPPASQPPQRRTSEDHWAPPVAGVPTSGYAGGPPPGQSAHHHPMSQASAPGPQQTSPQQTSPQQTSRQQTSPQQPGPRQPPPGPQGGVPRSEADFDEDDSVPRGLHRVRTRSSGEDLIVPLPGRRLSDARSTARVFRAVAVTALVLAVLAVAALGGFLAVIAGRGLPSAGRTAPQTDTFNTDAAAVFGGQYLRTCLTRTGSDDPNRLATARGMSTVEDPACTGGTEAKPRRIDQVTFNGTVQPVPGMSRARYLGFLTTGSDGTTAYLVPIFLDDPASGAGPRITGSIGQMPTGGYGQPVGDDPGSTQPLTDLDLAAQMKSSFLPEFLGAWAASADSLSQFLTPRASESARTGLRGSLRQPQVTDVLALPPKSAHRGGQNFDYANGSRVELQVQINASSQSQSYQPYGYRITIEQNGGKWFVADIQAGIAKVPSGPAPQTTRPTRNTTATPPTTPTPPTTTPR